MKKLTYIFDSFAVLAYLQAEPGGQEVRELLKKSDAGKISVLMSAINLGEIIYIIERKLGRSTADGILHDIFGLPVQLVESTMTRVLSAAHIKARYAISYADAFVVALSHERKGIIVTADPEFKQVESLVDILWL